MKSPSRWLKACLPGYRVLWTRRNSLVHSRWHELSLPFLRGTLFFFFFGGSVLRRQGMHGARQKKKTNNVPEGQKHAKPEIRATSGAGGNQSWQKRRRRWGFSRRASMLPSVACGIKQSPPLLPSGTTNPKPGRKCGLSFRAVLFHSFVRTRMKMPPLPRLYCSYAGSTPPDFLDAINWNKNKSPFVYICLRSALLNRVWRPGLFCYFEFLKALSL